MGPLFTFQRRRYYLVAISSQVSRGLPSLGSALRRHLIAAFLTTAAVVGLAAAYVTSVESTYTSTATVMLSPTPGNPLTPEAASGSTIQFTVAMQTEAEVVRTPAIRDAVSAELGRQVPGDGEALTVDVPANTQMLAISFTSSTPEAAREGAQGFADGVLGYRAERAARSQEARIEALGQQLERTDEDLRRATVEAEQGGVASYASREVELLVDKISRLSSNLSAAEAVSTDPGAVINPPELPEEADGLASALILIVACVFGLFLGIVMALLLEWRRDLIRDDDGAGDVGIPIFATVRAVPGDGLAPGGDELVHESYRRLRAGVLANGKSPHVLAVAGFDSDHSSAVATNLALALAEAKFSVLLVSADPQASRVEHILRIGDQPGWADVVQRRLSVYEALSHMHGLSVLPGGAHPAGVRELIAGPAFRRLVADVRPNFDYVVLAAAPAGSADGDAVFSAADSVLLVLRSNRTTKGLLLAALERFQALGISPLGAVKVAETRAAARSRRHHRAETSSRQSERRAERVRAGAHA